MSMKELVDRIKNEAVHVGGGIVKVDGFLNHRVDPAMMQRVGQSFAAQLTNADDPPLTGVITAEVSGIPAALNTALVLGVPMIYARKHRSSVMTDEYWVAPAESRTKSEVVDLMISRKFLGAKDRVLIIDDFLATGSTISALVGIVRVSGASLCGIGAVIEKPHEGGRKILEQCQVPIVSLASIEFDGDALTVS